MNRSSKVVEPVERSRRAVQQGPERREGETAKTLTPAGVLGLQRAAGNQAVSRLVRPTVAPLDVQRWPWWLSPSAPKVVTIGKEKVRVAGPAEEKEAKGIIAKLKKDFGVALSSPGTIAAIKTQYDKVGDTLDLLETNVWEMKEIRGVLAAVSHYAPIMGKKRKLSSLAARAQGVTSLGRVKQQVDANYKDAPLIAGVMGEYMPASKNVALFDTTTDLVDDRYVNAKTGKADNATTIEANAIHEMAHGLVVPEEQANWVAALGYWLDAQTPSGDVAAEDPPTQYAGTNASEDICESVAIFFTNRAALKAKCPEREALIAKVVEGWTPPKKKAVVSKSKTAKGGK